MAERNVAMSTAERLLYLGRPLFLAHTE